MDTAQYGELNSLFSVINILTVIGTAMGLSIAKFTAETKSDIGGNIKTIWKQSCIVGIPLFLIIAFALWKGMDFYIVSSILTSGAIVLFSLSYIFYGTMQGKKEFMGVSIFNLIQPMFKITIGILAILLIAKLTGSEYSYNAVFAVMMASSVVAIIYGYKKSEKSGLNFNSTVSDKNITKNIYRFFFFSLLSSICLVIFNNIDILIMRQFFEEETVGLYSSAALFGKIILYIPTALTIMMVPIVAESKEKGKTALKKTLLYSLGLSVFACIVLYILKDFIISLLMGEKYLSSTEYILPVCIMIIPLVLVTVLVNYLLASGYELFVSACCIGSVLMMIASIYFVHYDIQTILYILTIIYSFLFVILGVKCILENHTIGGEKVAKYKK